MGACCFKSELDRKPSFVAKKEEYDKADDGGTELAMKAVSPHRDASKAPKVPFFEKAVLGGKGKENLVSYGDVTVHYKFTGTKLGVGGFATTYLVKDNDDGNMYACKSVDKVKLNAQALLMKKDLLRELRDEVTNLHMLGVCEYIAHFKTAYEDRCFVHVLQEYCSGGELLQMIIKQDHYSEKSAAKIMFNMLKAVEYCHSCGIVHRDIKPENFIFADKRKLDEGGRLKLIDFGFSCTIKPGDILKESLGTDTYIAPEVLLKAYDERADIWSLGVCLYILFTGFQPHKWACECSSRGMRSVITERIKNGGGPPDVFDQDPKLKGVSAQGKAFLAKMVECDYQKRMTATELLALPWIAGNFEELAQGIEPLDISAMQRMKTWMYSDKLKKQALIKLAYRLPEADTAELRATFDSLDTEKLGSITLEQLRTALKSSSGETDAGLRRISQLRDFSDVAVLDESHERITFGEFAAAAMEHSVLQRRELIQEVFDEYSSGGFITKEHVGKILNEKDDDKISKIMIEMAASRSADEMGKPVDKVDFNDFLGFMTSDDPEAQKKLGIQIESPQAALKKGASVNAKKGPPPKLSVNTQSTQPSAFYGENPLSPMPATPNWKAIDESEKLALKTQKSGPTAVQRV